MTGGAADAGPVASVRPVEAGDRADWAALFLDYGRFYETEFAPAVVDGVWDWLLDADHEVSCLIARSEDRTIGFAHLRRTVDTFTAGPGWHLDDLYVASEYRGRGAAAALIAAVEEAARAGGGGTLRWITAASNVRAQSLYDRLATRTTWLTYEKET